MSCKKKKKIIIIMGVGPTYSCRGLFKHLGILPIPSVYLYSLMMFVFNNLDKFQLNNSVHGINTRNKGHLHRLITHLSAYQRGVYYTGVRLFNRLPTNIFTMMTKIFSYLHCVVIYWNTVFIQLVNSLIKLETWCN
jgi:hypothetical protein